MLFSKKLSLYRHSNVLSQFLSFASDWVINLYSLLEAVAPEKVV